MPVSKDLTVGEPSAVLRQFCLPMFGSIVFQQLYNLADSFVAGKLISEDALAAVGATGTIMFLIIGFMIGMTGGFAVVTAQKFGAREDDAVRHSVVSSISCLR